MANSRGGVDKYSRESAGSLGHHVSVYTHSGIGS
jgi:hypothetical protein